jgi:hypothetical protein
MKDKDLIKARKQISKIIRLQESVNNSYLSACSMRDHSEALKLSGQREILEKVWDLLKDALPKEQ